MADALAKYRAALKRYRKENPNVPFHAAQKRVSDMMKSGTISGTKKRKRRVGTPVTSHKTARRSSSQKSASIARVGSSKRKVIIDNVGKAWTVTENKISTRKKRSTKRELEAKKLVNKIEALEWKRHQEKNRDLRDIIQLEINACHDKLDRLKGSYKRKSA